MNDAFERHLQSALAPRAGLPDRRFIAAVQARIVMEDRLAAEHRALIANLIKQLAGLVAVAAALWWVGRSAPVAHWFAQSPPLGALMLLAAFGFVVAVFTGASRSGGAAVRIS